mgnify:CR=1 FL=1
MESLKYRAIRKYPNAEMIYFTMEDIINLKCPIEILQEFEGIRETIGWTTGVQDINKKESYLGDILKEHITEWSSKKDKDHAKKCFFIVKKEKDSNNMYLEYNFNIRGYWETNNLPINRIEDLEIAGNIFEDEDMIKKEV